MATTCPSLDTSCALVGFFPTGPSKKVDPALYDFEVPSLEFSAEQMEAKTEAPTTESVSRIADNVEKAIRRATHKNSEY